LGTLPCNGGLAVGKQQFQPALIAEKYLARVKKCTLETNGTGQIAP
jgi:hypothetical protein